MTHNNAKLFACLAAGASQVHLTSGVVTWPSGRQVDTFEESYLPHEDPDFGFHLKLRDGRFNVDMSFDRDKGVTYVLDYNPKLNVWATSKISRAGQYNDMGDWEDHSERVGISTEARGMYESLYHCLIANSGQE